VCLGIDLGTTNSCVAVFSNGANAEVIENIDSERTTPSVVSFDDSQVLIGKNAAGQRTINTKHTFYCVKRLIGRKFSDTLVTSDRKNYTYRVYNGPEGKPVLRVATERYNSGKKESGVLKPIELEPEQISALVLGYLKESADRKSTTPTNKAVITVPANFNEYQKRATKDAAKIAGLEALETISEPTAACITYACMTGYSPDERHVLVYDYGGGTLDVSLVKIKGNEFTVIATAGDSHCGGADIDQYLCEMKISEIMRKFHKNIAAPTREDAEDVYSRQRARLLQSCEESKKNLSSTLSRYEINLPDFIDGENYITGVSKNDINDYVDSHKDQLVGPIKLVFDQSKLDKSKITDFILVGGSSHIPAIQTLVGEEIGKPPYMPLNPDEAIATGAAIYGAVAQKKKVGDFDAFKIRDVTPMAIGIGIRGGKVDVQIPRNTPIPFNSEWIRYKKNITPGNSVETVSLPVYEGDSGDQRTSHKVGKFDIIIKCEGRSESSVVVYGRVSVTKDGITVHAAEGKEPPKTEKYEKGEIKTDQLVHSPAEITNLMNANKKYTEVILTEEKVDYQIKCSSVLTEIGKGKNKYTKDAKKRKNIGTLVDEIKKEVRDNYTSVDEDNPLPKEKYEEYIQRAEDGIKSIVPEYTRPPKVQEIMDS
jgi:L1 cell adhesion molecule like protein